MNTTKKQLPPGWFMAGSNPENYKFSVDTKTLHSGLASGHLTTTDESPKGFGTIMQEFLADSYKGKRVKFSAFIKTKDVADWAGLWMKIEGPGHDSLGFDNMKNRAIQRTTDWKKYEVVLDVPNDAKLIAFGILLNGKGSVWINEIALEETSDAKATNMEKPLPSSPMNLTFLDN